MCLSKFSNIDLLREVALNLYSTEENVNVSGLCERELAALINTYYQGEKSDALSSGEKRKIKVDAIISDNKKLKIDLKEDFFMSEILSVLELLPNEVFEMILRYLGGGDKKNMRLTSKGVYHKTTMMTPMFQVWCFDSNLGYQPDFVLQTNKNFHIFEMSENEGKDPVNTLINKSAKRITSVTAQYNSLFLYSLNFCNPAKFSNVTSLDLENVHFSNSSLLVLAPQLVDLRLSEIQEGVEKFDISSVDEESKCFTKLRTLSLENIEIDVVKILSKSCKTLKCFKYYSFKEPDVAYGGLVHLEEKLSLSNLSITLNEIHDGEPLRNLLSKCSESLKTLTLILCCSKVDFSSLLTQTMKITELEVESGSEDEEGIEIFLNKCSLVHNLFLDGFEKKFDVFVTKNLRKLRLDSCSSKCITSILKQASKSSLQFLRLRHHDTEDYEFHEIPELDTVWLDDGEIKIEEVSKLFPQNTKGTTEKLDDDLTVFRRVYELS